MKPKLKVAVLLFDQVNAIDVAGPMEAFATAKNQRGQSVYTLVTWSLDGETVRSESGLRLCADKAVPKRPVADILLIPGGVGARQPGALKSLSGWLRKNYQRFDRVASVCTGTYVLAEAGLIGGRQVTTHWAHAADLQSRYPEVEVNSDALFLRDGRFYSSGGVSAGIDLALDLIEADFGSQTAMDVARELVVFLRRSGAQAQFSMPLRMQAGAPNRLSNVCRWAASNLSVDLSVEALATRASMSTRQFSRRFSEAFGLSPAAYIKRLRLDAGRLLLGQGLSVAQVSQAVGYGTADGFSRAFESHFGISPSQYQQRFRADGVIR